MKSSPQDFVKMNETTTIVHNLSYFMQLSNSACDYFCVLLRNSDALHRQAHNVVILCVAI